MIGSIVSIRERREGRVFFVRFVSKEKAKRACKKQRINVRLNLLQALLLFFWLHTENAVSDLYLAVHSFWIFP